MFQYPEHPPAHIQVPSKVYFGQYNNEEVEVLPISENLFLMNILDSEEDNIADGEIVHVLEKSPSTFSTLLVSGSIL